MKGWHPYTRGNDPHPWVCGCRCCAGRGAGWAPDTQGLTPGIPYSYDHWHLGRSMGRGNLRGSRVGVCAGTVMGCHTAHPVPRPVQTRTHAPIFPWVHCDRTCKYCTVHTLHRTTLARYVFMSAFTYTHAHRQTLSQPQPQPPSHPDHNHNPTTMND